MKFIPESQSSGKVKGAMKLDSYDVNKDYSLTYIEISGEHDKIRFSGETRIYFIIVGSGTFVVNEIEFEVKENDVIVIEDGDVYEFSGEMKFVILHNPPFSPDQDEKI